MHIMASWPFLPLSTVGLVYREAFKFKAIWSGASKKILSQYCICNYWLSKAIRTPIMCIVLPQIGLLSHLKFKLYLRGTMQVITDLHMSHDACGSQLSTDSASHSPHTSPTNSLRKENQFGSSQFPRSLIFSQLLIHYHCDCHLTRCEKTTPIYME